MFLTLDYGSKIFAQTYLGVTYREPIVSPESLDGPSLFFFVLFIVLAFYAFLKVWLKKKEKIIEISQILFMSSVVGNLLDAYMYPGNIKWIFGFNFADLYLIGAITLLLSLINLNRKKV